MPEVMTSASSQVWRLAAGCLIYLWQTHHLKMRRPVQCTCTQYFEQDIPIVVRVYCPSPTSLTTHPQTWQVTTIQCCHMVMDLDTSTNHQDQILPASTTVCTCRCRCRCTRRCRYSCICTCRRRSFRTVMDKLFIKSEGFRIQIWV